MTLQEAIEDIERQMDTFMTVYVDAGVMDMFHREIKLTEDHFTGYFIERNKYKKYVYRMRPEQAEELRDRLRAVLAAKVAEKLAQ